MKYKCHNNKIYIIAAVCAAIALFNGINAYAGSWQQDMSKPYNDNGVTDWWWSNDDGSYPRGCWAWIDGNNDGLAECYYFNDAGYMLGGTVVNDGTGSYPVNENGAWLENGMVKVYPIQWVPGGKVLGAGGKSVGDGLLNPLGSGYSDQNATKSGMSDAEAYNKLMQIKAELPEGTSWDDKRFYVSGNRYGYGCAAFIFMVQDRLYGNAAKPRTVNTLNISELRVGDHLRIQNNTHSVIVLSNNGSSISVAEGNYNHCVHWGRVITEEELKKEFVYRETCYAQ